MWSKNHLQTNHSDVVLKCRSLEPLHISSSETLNLEARCCAFKLPRDSCAHSRLRIAIYPTIKGESQVVCRDMGVRGWQVPRMDLPLPVPSFLPFLSHLHCLLLCCLACWPILSGRSPNLGRPVLWGLWYLQIVTRGRQSISKSWSKSPFLSFSTASALSAQACPPPHRLSKRHQVTWECIATKKST